jgi:hypothetical protein
MKYQQEDAFAIGALIFFADAAIVFFARKLLGEQRASQVLGDVGEIPAEDGRGLHPRASGDIVGQCLISRALGKIYC